MMILEIASQLTELMQATVWHAEATVWGAEATVWGAEVVWHATRAAIVLFVYV